MTTRYIVGNVQERNGDMEYSSQIIMAYDEDLFEDEDTAAQAIACGWRGGGIASWDLSHSGCWSDDTLIFPFSGDQVISVNKAKSLNKFGIHTIHADPKDLLPEDE